MKLLLTSRGITNESIANAFKQLLNKDLAETQIAFVTTAGYFSEKSDKSWFVDQMLSVRNLNPKTFELVEFNSLRRELIIERLDASDVIFLSGGHAAALMHAIDRQNLRSILKKFAHEKLYCGISASSHITSPDLKLSTQPKNEEYAREYGYKADTGLSLIDFYIRAHYREAKHPHVTEEYVAELAQGVDKPIYAIDDESAVVVNGDKVSVVSEGEYKVFNI